MPRSVSRPAVPELERPSSRTTSQGVVVHRMEEVGQMLRWSRGMRQLRQRAAAESAGVSTTLLQGFERGDRGVHFDTALHILARLGYDVVLVPRDPEMGAEIEKAAAAGRGGRGDNG